MVNITIVLIPSNSRQRTNTPSFGIPTTCKFITHDTHVTGLEIILITNKEISSWNWCGFPKPDTLNRVISFLRVTIFFMARSTSVFMKIKKRTTVAYVRNWNLPLCPNNKYKAEQTENQHNVTIHRKFTGKDANIFCYIEKGVKEGTANTEFYRKNACSVETRKCKKN